MARESFSALPRVVGSTRAALNIGEVVVVMGGGPLGLLITQLVKLSGAAKVILVEPAPSRQQLGYKFGADAAIYPDEHLREQVSDLTGRRRVDAVFEVSGNPRAFDAASRLVGKLGRLHTGCGLRREARRV